MIQWELFNRHAFTQEEQDMIASLVDSGNAANITQAIMIDRPEKEYWAQKIVARYRQVELKQDTEALKELQEMQQKGEVMTPEIEARLQKKVDEERAIEKARRELEEAKHETSILESLASEPQVEEVKAETIEAPAPVVKRRTRKAKVEQPAEPAQSE